jgi:hypothetical protein
MIIGLRPRSFSSVGSTTANSPARLAVKNERNSFAPLIGVADTHADRSRVHALKKTPPQTEEPGGQDEVRLRMPAAGVGIFGPVRSLFSPTYKPPRARDREGTNTSPIVRPLSRAVESIRA